MRKQIAGIIIAFIATVGLASALQIGQFAGTWKGKRVETIGGSGSITKAKFSVKKTADGGISAIESGGSGFIGGNYTIKHAFKGNGVYKSTSYSGGIIFSTSAGKWKKEGQSIIISGTGKGGGESSHFSGSLRLVTSEKLVYTGKSGGVTVKITATGD